FLVPSLLALFIAVLIGWFTDEDKYHQIPYTYTFAVLGNLIGADIVRIPLLVKEGIMGSIGGAGAMDLVYLSGLISSLPLIFLYYWSEPLKQKKDLISRSRDRIDNGEYKKSHRLIYKAVKKDLDKARKLIEYISSNPFHDVNESKDTEVLKYLNFHPYVIFDFISFKNRKKFGSKEQAEKDFITGRLIKNGIKKYMDERINKLSYRIMAYIIDLIIIIIPIFLILYYLLQQGIIGIEIVSGTPTFKGRTVLFAILSLSISIQFLYFTILEWFLGGSLGKLLLGLRVMDDDFEKLSFIQSAARNAGRYADIMLFFYIISIVLIFHSSEDKRIGDHIAGSRVVKIK
ncbi:MAG: RDD family protein, partial [Thermoplasmatota archaeon]